MATISRAIIKSYDVATHTATVQIAGSLAVWLDAVPVSDGIAPADVVAGRECGVIFFTDDNPADAAVVSVHNALPVGSHRLRDQDGDTYVDVERTANENKVAMGVGGTLRWLLLPASPHATLTGDLQMSGTLALLNGAMATVKGWGFNGIGGGVYVPGDPEGYVGFAINLGTALGFTPTEVVGLGGHTYAKNAATCTAVKGLDFAVGTANVSGTLALASAVSTVVQVTGASTVTEANVVKLETLIVNAGNLIGTLYGLNLPGSAINRMTNVVGLKFGLYSGAAVAVIPLDCDGPARTDNVSGSVHRPNVQFGSRTRNFAGGDGVIGLAYATTNPPLNPAGGIVMYVAAATGDSKFKGFGGQVCTLPTGGAPNVVGAKAGNVALANLCIALAALGLIVDGTA